MSSSSIMLCVEWHHGIRLQCVAKISVYRPELLASHLGQVRVKSQVISPQVQVESRVTENLNGQVTSQVTSHQPSSPRQVASHLPQVTSRVTSHQGQVTSKSLICIKSIESGFN